MRVSLILTLLSVAGLSACGQSSRNAPVPEPAAPAKVQWAVASANPLATKAGADILADGGDAIDAAIAVQAVLGLVEPQSSGLGGGAFLLYYDAESETITAFDGREIAPASATPTMFLLDDGSPMPFYDAVTSGKSVGVPGVVAMLAEVHELHGKKPWASLFADAEQLATDGFALSPRLSELLGRYDRFAETPSARALFYQADGTPLPAGTLFKNPDYAATVRKIANGGVAAFYQGDIAEEIIRVVNEKAGPGTLTMDDFAAYSPTVRPTVCGAFRAYEICSMGPPSSGGVSVLQILGLFDRVVGPETSAGVAWAKYIEASRLAYADRAIYLADPRAMGDADISSDDVVQALVSPAYLDLRAALIGDTAVPTVEAGDPLPFVTKPAADASPELPGTSHFSIMDREGNIISMTTTVEFAFGSHLIAGGMVLNNQLTDFSFLPEREGVAVANAVGPRKKPRSSMSPVIVLENGDPVMAIGSPGGPAIIGYVAKTLIAALAFDMPLQQAVDFPHMVVPRGDVIAERALPPEIGEALAAYGYSVTPRDLASGLYGFRLLPDGRVEGAADARREGNVLIGD